MKTSIRQLAMLCIKAALDSGLPSGGGSGPVPTEKQIKRVERVLRMYFYLESANE